MRSYFYFNSVSLPPIPHSSILKIASIAIFATLVGCSTSPRSPSSVEPTHTNKGGLSEPNKRLNENALIKSDATLDRLQLRK